MNHHLLEVCYVKTLVSPPPCQGRKIACGLWKQTHPSIFSLSKQTLSIISRGCSERAAQWTLTQPWCDWHNSCLTEVLLCLFDPFLLSLLLSYVHSGKHTQSHPLTELPPVAYIHIHKHTLPASHPWGFLLWLFASQAACGHWWSIDREMCLSKETVYYLQHHTEIGWSAFSGTIAICGMRQFFFLLSFICKDVGNSSFKLFDFFSDFYIIDTLSLFSCCWCCCCCCMVSFIWRGSKVQFANEWDVLLVRHHLSKDETQNPSVQHAVVYVAMKSKHEFKSPYSCRIEDLFLPWAAGLSCRLQEPPEPVDGADLIQYQNDWYWFKTLSLNFSASPERQNYDSAVNHCCNLHLIAKMAIVIIIK